MELYKAELDLFRILCSRFSRTLMQTYFNVISFKFVVVLHIKITTTSKIGLKSRIDFRITYKETREWKIYEFWS